MWDSHCGSSKRTGSEPWPPLRGPGGDRLATGGGGGADGDAAVDADPERPRSVQHLIGHRLLCRPALLEARLYGICGGRPEADGLPIADRHLREVQPLPVAGSLGAMNGHWHNGSAALQRKAPDTWPCPLGDALVA